MRILGKIFNFYIDSSIHVALSCFALVRITQHYFNISKDFHIGYFAFFGTIVGYNFVKYEALARAKKAQMKNKLKAIAEKLIEGKKTKRAYLGIISNTVMIPKELSEETEIDQETGVMVFSVEWGSPAKKAGLAMGDVIVGFNGKRVTDFYDLPQLLTDEVIGKETKVRILRGERLTTVTIVPVQTEGDDNE